MREWLKRIYKKYIWFWWNVYEAEWSIGWKYEEQWLSGLEWLFPYVMCLGYFHEPVDDHCMMPEHRYCWKCGIPTPYAKISN